MKTKILFLFAVSFFIHSCSYQMNEEQILNGILKGKSEKVLSAFYKDYRIDKDKFSKVLESYSDKINTLKLKPVLYRDEYNFRKRDRYGYLFVDDKNNLHYSITFKYSEMNDGEKLVNFMDFRAAEDDLPSIKFPSRLPLKGVLLPTKNPASSSYIDSMKVVGPKIINGIQFYSEYTLKPDYMESYGDTLKTNVLRFNFGNKKIKDNIGKILGKLSTRMDLKNYAFSYYESYSQKTIYISYDKLIPSKDLKSVKKTLEEVLDTKVKFKRRGRSSNKTKFMMVGGLNTEAKIRIPLF